MDAGDYAKAEPLYQRSLKITEQTAVRSPKHSYFS